MSGSSSTSSPRVMVLAPSPLLTVTVGSGSEGDEIHFHPGGQGVWVARLERVLPPRSPVGGAGDSVTAGIAVALARGCSLPDAVRLGTAAGTLNVTRRGLASGSRREIELLVPHVELIEVAR